MRCRWVGVLGSVALAACSNPTTPSTAAPGPSASAAAPASTPTSPGTGGRGPASNWRDLPEQSIQLQGLHVRSGRQALSRNGRFVALTAGGGILGGTVSPAQVYVYDRDSGEARLVTVGIDGAPGDARSQDPQISEDGSTVVFFSYASNLTADPPDANPQYPYRPRCFRWNAHRGTIELVSRALDGAPVATRTCVMSADGRVVAYEAAAAVYVAGRDGGPPRVASIDATGKAASPGGWSDAPMYALSGNGRFLAFQPPSPPPRPILIRDLEHGVTTALAGSEEDHSRPVFVSNDGRVTMALGFSWTPDSGRQPTYDDLVLFDAKKARSPAKLLALGGPTLTVSAEASVTVDGRRVVLWYGVPDRILVLDTRTGATAAVTYSLAPSLAARPTISWDGDQIAFDLYDGTAIIVRPDPLAR